MSNKTLGKVSTNLIQTLYEKDKVIFNIKDTQAIINKDERATADLLSELVKRNLISRLKRGKYIIIPQEIGSVKKYVGNWFIAAKEIVNSREYYISFYSAMDFWGMVTHPVNKIFISTPKRQMIPKEMKGFLKFVFVDKKFIFGIVEKWIDKQKKVRFSDIEKTILDCLFHPEHCGGIAEIATGIYLVRNKIDYKKLIQYVEKYNKNVIAKRLGYILEILGISIIRKDLKKYIRGRYDLFDPYLSKKNLNKNDWRLIDNVSPEQIKKIIRT